MFLRKLQLYSPRMGALAVEVFAVENLFTNNHTRSHEDHGFPIEKIRQRLTQQLKVTLYCGNKIVINSPIEKWVVIEYANGLISLWLRGLIVEWKRWR